MSLTCINCRTVYNQNKVSSCPKCHTPNWQNSAPSIQNTSSPGKEKNKFSSNHESNQAGKGVVVRNLPLPGMSWSKRFFDAKGSSELVKHQIQRILSNDERDGLSFPDKVIGPADDCFFCANPATGRARICNAHFSSLEIIDFDFTDVAEIKIHVEPRQFRHMVEQIKSRLIGNADHNQRATRDSWGRNMVGPIPGFLVDEFIGKDYEFWVMTTYVFKNGKTVRSELLSIIRNYQPSQSEVFAQNVSFILKKVVPVLDFAVRHFGERVQVCAKPFF